MEFLGGRYRRGNQCLARASGGTPALRLHREWRWATTWNAFPRITSSCNTDHATPPPGLFIKLGQSIGIQATILPKPYRDAFSTIFDAAPQVPYEEVEKVFREEFGGRKPLDIFESFDKVPIASASIAQVHRARYRLPGVEGRPGEIREVAVKVQKPAISKQLKYDLWSYQSVVSTS